MTGPRSRRSGAAAAFVLAAAAFTALGCPSGEPPLPDTVPELRDAAVAARDAATVAMDAVDVDAAETAAARAEAAYEKAVGLSPPAPEGATGAEPAEAEIGPLEATREAAVAARHTADRTAELAVIADVNSGIRHGVYTGARSTALSYAFSGLAVAAEQAAKQDLDEMKPEARDSALLAADVAAKIAGRAPRADGETPDWTGIAEDMRRLGEEPPPELRLFLAAAFLVTARDRMALWEIEACDPDALRTRELAAAARVLRGLIYRLHGCPILAEEQLHAAFVSDTEQIAWGAELQGGVHLLLAAFAISNDDLGKADQELARAIRVSPDNPIAAFLTGERRAADGEWEEAAESLEKLAAETKNEDLARVIAERAREIRDGKGPPPTFLSDPDLIGVLVMEFLRREAESSEAAAAVLHAIESGRAFARRVMAKIPGMGPDGEDEGEGGEVAKSEDE